VAEMQQIETTVRDDEAFSFSASVAETSAS
jgi:hypothetical protein